MGDPQDKIPFLALYLKGLPPPSLHLPQKIYHLNGGQGAVIPLIAGLASCPGYGLLNIFGGDDAKQHRHSCGQPYGSIPPPLYLSKFKRSSL